MKRRERWKEGREDGTHLFICLPFATLSGETSTKPKNSSQLVPKVHDNTLTSQLEQVYIEFVLCRRSHYKIGGEVNAQAYALLISSSHVPSVGILLGYRVPAHRFGREALRRYSSTQ